MRNYVNICFSLKNLLKKVDLLSVSEGVSHVFISLDFLIEQLQSDQLRKGEISQKLNTKVSAKTSSWNVANESIVKVEAMELQTSKDEVECTACKENIKSWEEQIEKLKLKTQTAKDRRDEIWKLNLQELDVEI